MTKIITVAGQTASGKSSLARFLCENLKGSFVISQDDFRRLKVIPEKEDNYESFDMKELVRVVEYILHKQPPYSIPSYNFEKDVKKEYLLMYKPTALIIEGTYVLVIPELVKQSNFKIFLHVDADICLIRRLIRDVKKRGKKYDDIIIKYIKHIKPTIDDIINPSAKIADYVARPEVSPLFLVWIIKGLWKLQGDEKFLQK
jgi:uridine kinase